MEILPFLFVGVVIGLSWMARHRIAAFVASKRRTLVGVSALVMAALSSSVAFAQDPELDLNLDLTPLFNSINDFFPSFFEILAIAGGITIAITLGRFLINAIAGAFMNKGI